MIYGATIWNLKDKLKMSELEELVVEGCAPVGEDDPQIMQIHHS